MNALQAVRFSFAHDTPGLADGVVAYRPTPGDLLLDAWVQLDEVWNGTTPLFDIGTFVDSSQQQSGRSTGLYFGWAAPSDLSDPELVDTEDYGNGLAFPAGVGIVPLSGLNTVWDVYFGLRVPAIATVPTTEQQLSYGPLAVTGSGSHGVRVVPAKFTATNPLKVVVSQDATPGGPDPRATKGKATLHVLVLPA